MQAGLTVRRTEPLPVQSQALRTAIPLPSLGLPPRFRHPLQERTQSFPRPPARTSPTTPSSTSTERSRSARALLLLPQLMQAAPTLRPTQPSPVASPALRIQIPLLSL